MDTTAEEQYEMQRQTNTNKTSSFTFMQQLMCSMQLQYEPTRAFCVLFGGDRFLYLFPEKRR